MTKLVERLAVLLNGLGAGSTSAAEVEHLVAPAVHRVDDGLNLLGQGPQPSLRIAIARLARIQAGGWACLLVRPGRLAGLRGPAQLTRDALAQPSSPELGAVPVVVGHHGQIAIVGVSELPESEALDHDSLTLRILPAERPLSPATPAEASLALSTAMREAASALTELGTVAGSRPDPADTIRLGSDYPPANQRLLDQSLTVLAIVAAADGAAAELPHSHAVTSRARVLDQLRSAALDGVQSALSWPTTLMR